jgi:hypothetical protein
VIDHCLSKIIDLPVFNSKSSGVRVYRRAVLTCRRNGGVFSDLESVIETLYGGSVENEKVRVEENGERWDSMQQLFNSETGLDFHSVFSDFEPVPIVREYGDQWKATLKGGETVTITTVFPRKGRMREIQMFPAKIVSGIVEALFPRNSMGGGLSYFVRRLTFDLEKEARARQRILQSLGVDLLKPPSEVIRAANQIDFPLRIAPPIVGYSSGCILVTGGPPVPHGYIGRREAGAVIAGAAELLAENLIVPDLGRRNILSLGAGNVTLDRFASLVRLDDSQSRAIREFIARGPFPIWDPTLTYTSWEMTEAIRRLVRSVPLRNRDLPPVIHAFLNQSIS